MQKNLCWFSIRNLIGSELDKALAISEGEAVETT